MAGTNEIRVATLGLGIDPAGRSREPKFGAKSIRMSEMKPVKQPPILRRVSTRLISIALFER